MTIPRPLPRIPAGPTITTGGRGGDEGKGGKGKSDKGKPDDNKKDDKKDDKGKQEPAKQDDHKNDDKGGNGGDKGDDHGGNGGNDDHGNGDDHHDDKDCHNDHLSWGDRSAPSMGANTPTAFGAGWGDLWGGLSYAARARYVDANDGEASGGFGLGNPRRNIGIEVNVYSFSTVREAPFRRGAVDIKLHRQLGKGLAVAAGWESALSWGPSDGGRSVYAVASHYVSLGRNQGLLTTLGVGNGRFQSEQAVGLGQNGLSVFGSAAVQVVRPLSLIANWTGQDLTMSASLAPFRKLGLVLGIGAADITGRAGDGARLVTSIGWGFGSF